jgi:hypothetical protein
MIDVLEKGVFGLVGWAVNSGYWAGVSVGPKPQFLYTLFFNFVILPLYFENETVFYSCSVM